MRLAVLSRRDIDWSLAARNLEGPFEDALASYDGVTLVPPPSLRRASLRSTMPAWLSAIRTVRRADTVMWTQFHLRPEPSLWALAYVRPLARRAFFAVDSWGNVVDDVARIASAQRVSACFVMFREAFERIRRRYPSVPAHWLPAAYNQDVFRERGLDRDVFAFWMGRKHEPLHRALTRYCSERGLQLVDTGYPSGAELASLTARSRYFVVTPPDLDNPRRTGSFSPITMRYLEGAGAGCRLLGVAPRSGELARMLGPNAIVECSPDGEQLAEAIAHAEADENWDRHRLDTSERVRRDHTWAVRATQVLETLQHGD